MMIESYLDDTVGAKIRFSREEFQEFYDANLESFRGEEEVRLDIMILDDRDQAAEAAGRLAEGADFGYIFKQYNPEQEIALGKANFIRISELSEPFRKELDHMKPGDSSGVVDMPMGFMVFKLDARRPGAVAPLEAVEMDIRRVMFARKFQELLDAQLALLRENSEIQRWPERIEAYLQPAGEGD
jgi:parvulin-like peptidyl-prolyl isomerase